MKPRKYNNPPPARSEAVTSAPERRSSTAPSILNPVDEVTILTASPMPRRWLRVAIAPGTEPALAALNAAWFVTRLRVVDKRLRLTIDRQKSCANKDELVLVFAPAQGGSLAIAWLEEVKPVVRELATEVGIELKDVEVIVEE
jgi:hypothetical protein